MNGISDFPPNFVANNQIDVDSVRNSSSKAILCSSCNEQLPATARCLDCMEFLCYACHNAHSRVRVTKDHRVSYIFLIVVASLEFVFLYIAWSHSPTRLTKFCLVAFSGFLPFKIPTVNTQDNFNCQGTFKRFEFSKIRAIECSNERDAAQKRI